MGKYQALKGDPTNKQIFLSNEFIGGVNLTSADDSISDQEFRYLSNFDLSVQGALPKRKGWGKEDLLSYIFSDSSYTDNLHIFTVDPSTMFLMLPITDTYNVLQTYHNFKDITELAQSFPSSKLDLIIGFVYDNHEHFRYLSITIDNSLPTKLSRTIVHTATVQTDFSIKNNLMNISYALNEQGVYFCDNSKDGFDNLIWFDFKTQVFYISSANVYKPVPLEIRKVGFNVLGDNPLTWIESSSLSTNSMQGVYLTLDKSTPLLNIPPNVAFYIHVMFTGTASDFTFTFRDANTLADETPLEYEAVVTKDGSSVAGLAIYKIEFQNNPSSEVEMRLKFTDTTITLPDFIDYYTVQAVDVQAQPVTKLSLKEYKMTSIYNRAVYYAKNIIWFSDIQRYDYIPNYNYLSLPIDETDEIVKIVYFNQSTHIVFTRKQIYKITGSFGSDDFGLYLVSDNIGCLSPNSVRSINDKLYFMSSVGLRCLVNNYYRTDLQNIKVLDEKVEPILDATSRDTYAVIFDNQYVLFNNYRGTKKYVTLQSTTYKIPDTLRYYVDLESYTFDDYPENTGQTTHYPEFIYQVGNRLLSFKVGQAGLDVYRYGKGYTDFGKVYRCIIETPRLSFGYPVHIKKIKKLVVKMSGGAKEQDIYISAYADGTEVFSPKTIEAKVLQTGEVTYDVRIDATYTVPSNLNYIGEAIIGEDKLGYNPLYLTRQRVGNKCLNFSLKLECEDEGDLSLLSLAYEIVIRKVKEI